MSLSVWDELVEKFKNSLGIAIDQLKERDIENIPGARDKLIEKFTQIMTYLPRNDGEILQSIIDNSIQKAFFPRTKKLAVAFKQILNSRTPEQDYIIQELINGFISSAGKSIASNSEGTILDSMVEAFKKRRDFKIVDYQFYAMHGNPDKPRKHVLEKLKNICEFLRLESEEFVRINVKDGEEKVYTFYSFPEEITDILEGKYLEILDNGEKIITDKFDKMVFISYFLAKLSVNRNSLDVYTINGISAIFALIIIISLMPKIQIDEKNPINRDKHFDPQMMSVIPKSWMAKNVLFELMPPLIQILSFRIGGNKWLEKIATTEIKKKMHLQAQFLLKDVNKWILGNMCRVEIPIFVEISSILNEVAIGTDRGDD